MTQLLLLQKLVEAAHLMINWLLSSPANCWLLHSRVSAAPALIAEGNSTIQLTPERTLQALKISTTSPKSSARAPPDKVLPSPPEREAEQTKLFVQTRRLVYR